MSRKLILGLVFSGLVGLAAGCSSKTDPTSLPPETAARDYSEYKHINRKQRGQGDALGMKIAASDDKGNTIVRAPAAKPAARPRVATPTVRPEPVLPESAEDLAGIPVEE